MTTLLDLRDATLMFLFTDSVYAALWNLATCKNIKAEVNSYVKQTPVV